MSPSELIEAGERLYGKHWRKPLSEILGIDIATLRRWTSADVAVPRPAALAISLLVEKAEKEPRS